MVMNPSDYIWDKIDHMNGTASTTAEIEEAVKALFKEIGAVSAPFGYQLPEFKTRTNPRGVFPAHICTSVNEVQCHGVPDDTPIDWANDVVNVDISFKWKGTYYDTCQSWGNRRLSEISHIITHAIADMVRDMEFKISPFEIGLRTARLCKDYGVEALEHFGGHGIGADIHMPPFIPAFAYGSRIPLFLSCKSCTIEPIIHWPDDTIYAQTEVQLWLP